MAVRQRDEAPVQIATHRLRIDPSLLSRDRGSGRRDKPLQPVHLTLYTKANCSLCERAWEATNEVRRSLEGQLATTLTLVDITTDAALIAAYKYDVPVLLVEGRPAFRLRVDPERLRARLIDGIPAPLEEQVRP
jgi:hypothetical protein